MALLKSGSTVGGNLIWHQGVLQLYPAGDSLYLKNYKIFTEHDQPTPAQVGLGNVTNDAQVKKAGDTMTGDLTIQTPGTNAASLFLNGAQIRANNDTALILSSKKALMYFRPNGDTDSTGQVTIDTAGTVLGNRFFISAAQHSDVRAATRKDYVDNAILAGDAKQVSKTGDTMTGVLRMSAPIEMSAGQPIWGYETGTTAKRYLIKMSTANVVEVGDTTRNVGILSQSDPTLLRGSDSKTYKFYHEGNKPSNSDVGLSNVTNDPQVKWLALPDTTTALKYVKIASATGTGTGRTQATFMFNGVNNYGGNATWTDIVSFSARGIAATGSATQAIANAQLKHNRIGRLSVNGITTDAAQFGIVKNNNLLELWVKLPNYTNQAKMSILYLGGVDLHITDGGATPPAGVVWVTPIENFTTMNPPTPADVDAVSKSQGGTFDKEVSFLGGVTVPYSSVVGADYNKNGLYPGNGDGATFDKANMDIKSWYGIGIASTFGTAGRVMWINSRTGAMETKGTVKGSSLHDSSGRVYSPGNKPTSTDVNAVAKSGDTMTGTLNINNADLTLAGNRSINFNKTGVNPKNFRIYHAGDATRGGRLEIAGEGDGQWIAYFQQYPNNTKELMVNGSVKSQLNLSVGNAIVQTDGNINGSAFGGYLSNFITNGDNSVRARADDAWNIAWDGQNNRVNEMQRGPRQASPRLNGWAEYEVPHGYITGYVNETGDGNMRFTSWYYRVPQIHVPSRGWTEIWNQ